MPRTHAETCNYYCSQCDRCHEETENMCRIHKVEEEIHPHKVLSDILTDAGGRRYVITETDNPKATDLYYL